MLTLELSTQKNNLPEDMSTHHHHPRNAPVKKRQGGLLAFGVTGAFALAIYGCSRNEATMVVPPGNFSPNNAVSWSDTNQPPTNATVYASSGHGGYLGTHGYFPVYGYPNYYFRPAPGSTVEVVRGSTDSFVATSPDEARSVARGGFGEAGGEGGHGFGGGE